ncbi:hypothetical protein D3C75_304450 [compost metagenome]
MLECARRNARQASVVWNNLVIAVVVADNTCNITVKLVTCTNLLSRIAISNQEALGIKVV